MDSLRPAGAGPMGTAEPFVRSAVSPRGGLVLAVDLELPSDWPDHDGAIETTLGHAVGWTCEVRRSDVVLLNPLGEGVAKAPAPVLGADWLDNVRHDGSCALFLVPAEAAAGFAELTIAGAQNSGRFVAATVRTSIDPAYGTAPSVGRNAPCPCGSGKKHKHCCG